jgi:hypothetical protein
MGREARNQNNLMVMKHNSEDEFQNYRIDSFLTSKNLSSRRKEERKSNSDTHSPFVSMNDQMLPDNPIDDYGRTWTSATLATPCDNEFWETEETKKPQINQNESFINHNENTKKGQEDSKVIESCSDIIKNVKLTYLSASSLSDDRWLCPI